MNKIKSGKVIFWNPVHGYGFIEFLESSNSIFFHNRNCNYKKIELFDHVSFEVIVIEHGKHKGKKNAININFKNRGGVKEYDLRVGSVQHWNGKSGFIDYPTDGKEIILFHTRLMFSKELKDGELVVFNPIVSFKDTSKLFAFFAYPLRFENDLAFLMSQYMNFQIPALRDYIMDISKTRELTEVERFELELFRLGHVNKGEDYLLLVDLIKRYKVDHDYRPDHNVLDKYVADNFLIQLWETRLIDTYDVDTIKDYFIKAKAETKRFIAHRVNEEDKEVILNHYFHLLQNANKLDRVSNDLKTFLSIIFRNEETKISALYEKVKSYLMLSLTPDELIDLWFSGYLELNESFIIENLKATDDDSIRKLLQRTDPSGNRVFENLISRIYVQYFVDYVHSERNFKDEYPNLVRYLKILESEFKPQFEEVIKLIKDNLTNYQTFILWILDVKIDFEYHQYVYENLPSINHYFRLRYCLRRFKEKSINDLNDLVNKVPVNLMGLKEFAKNYEWNKEIYPTPIFGIKESSFLGDVTNYNNIFKTGLDILDLADHIYNSVEKYNEIHVRLWLNYLNDKKSYYDYVGFRDCFKYLTSAEQKEFRDRANERDYAVITSNEESEVKPCMDFEFKGTGKVYRAFVENIYFSDGMMKLRMEDKEYTQGLSQEYSSTGLNRIPSQSSLNRIPIEVIVENTKIIHVNGLDELFTRIHTGEISKALGTVKKDLSMARNINSYAEDWKLKKQVIDFLNTSQDTDKEVKQVHEPKNFYRRLDVRSGIDSFELTCLYTIKLEDRYAIVWENIDMTEDRATYVFKCLPENHEMQMQKISDAIVSFSQLRSALSSLKEDEKLQIFKDNLGFIGSIRKKRGANESFKNWSDKFQDILKERTPELPGEEGLAQIDGWSPFIPHTVSINKQRNSFRESARIIEKKLAVTDQLEEGGFRSNERQSKELIDVSKAGNDEDGTINNPITGYNEELTTLKALELFNQYFTENLKFSTL